MANLREEGRESQCKKETVKRRIQVPRYRAGLAPPLKKSKTQTPPYVYLVSPELLGVDVRAGNQVQELHHCQTSPSKTPKGVAHNETGYTKAFPRKGGGGGDRRGSGGGMRGRGGEMGEAGGAVTPASANVANVFAKKHLTARHGKVGKRVSDKLMRPGGRGGGGVLDIPVWP